MGKRLQCCSHFTIIPYIKFKSENAGFISVFYFPFEQVEVERATGAFTLGAGSTVECGVGATCDVVCEGDCNVRCTNGAACTLQCAGDTEPSPLVDSGGCAA